MAKKPKKLQKCYNVNTDALDTRIMYNNIQGCIMMLTTRLTQSLHHTKDTICGGKCWHTNANAANLESNIAQKVEMRTETGSQHTLSTLVTWSSDQCTLQGFPTKVSLKSYHTEHTEIELDHKRTCTLFKEILSKPVFTREPKISFTVLHMQHTSIVCCM